MGSTKPPELPPPPPPPPPPKPPPLPARAQTPTEERQGFQPAAHAASLRNFDFVHGLRRAGRRSMIGG